LLILACQFLVIQSGYTIPEVPIHFNLVDKDPVLEYPEPIGRIPKEMP
jgi:hypothetical protein